MTKERILQLLESTQKNCAAGRPTVGSDPHELAWLLHVVLMVYDVPFFCDECGGLHAVTERCLDPPLDEVPNAIPT